MELTAQLFKALAEPVRLRILLLLLEEERCVCDLMAVLEMPQSTISRHLAYLKNAGWVNGRRQGGWMYYKLAGPVSELHAGLLALLGSRLPELTEARKDLAALDHYKNTKTICDYSKCYTCGPGK